MATKEEYQRNKANGNAARYHETAKAKRKALITRIARGEATTEEVASIELARQKRHEYHKRWYAANKEAKDRQNKAWAAAHIEEVSRSSKRWYEANRDKHLERSKKYNEEHPEERASWAKALKKRMQEHTPERYIVGRLKARNRKGRCNLAAEDIIIPAMCPLLGIPLQFAKGQPKLNSPSVDCIDPTKGYVKGNVWVISKMANTMKSCASKSELRAFCLNALQSMESGMLADMPEDIESTTRSYWKGSA